MTNYLRLLPAALALAACARAAETPQGAPAAKPAAQVARPASGGVLSAPAGTTMKNPASTAGAAAPAAATRYVLAPGGNELAFTFVQEGSETKASFKQFTVALVYDEKNLATSSLDVKVQAASVFTDYEDRDSEIRGADLLSVERFPSIHYQAGSLEKTAKGIEAVGKLTVRDKTRDLRIPLVIRKVTVGGNPGLEVTGSTQVNRLDYGVGQGDWSSTDTVKNDIKLTWKVQLVPAK
jgi:polyisoprenoid-binding protein YceI